MALASTSARLYDLPTGVWLLFLDDIVAGGAGSRSASKNFFGHAVSLSGNRALVGAFSSDGNGDQMGHAYVYVFNGTTWTQEADLTPSDGTMGNQFGGSVSLSGSRALVGAVGSGGAAAYVFVFDGTTWTQEAKLTPSGGAFSFGQSVSLDGTTALIGDSNLQHFKGAAYIFAFNGETWQQQAKLTPAEGEKARFFGTSVSLFDGRAAIGAYGSRSAFVFTKSGSTWIEEAALTPAEGTSDDLFGESVSLTRDRLLVGAPGGTSNGIQSGVAYIFDFDGTNWQETAELAPVDGNEDDSFGLAVSIAGDRALVGAFAAKNIMGAAYLFAFDGTAWREQASVAPSDGAPGDEFGLSVSLSSGRALVGARGNIGNGFNSGAAYIFGR